MVDPFGPGAGQGQSAIGAPRVVFILLTHEAGGGCGDGLTPDPFPVREGENDAGRFETGPCLGLPYLL
jgi:hypothetical protein